MSNFTLEAKLSLNRVSKTVHCFLAPGSKYPAGRESGWMRLPHSSVSRIHFNLWMEKGRLMIEDAGSKNGLQVNGKTLKLGVLNVGDVVSAGDFQVEIMALDGGTVSEQAMRETKGPEKEDPKDWTRVQAMPPRQEVVAAAPEASRRESARSDAFTVEAIRLDVSFLKDFLSTAVSNPRQFFQRVETAGELKAGLRLIAIVAGVTSLLSALMAPTGFVTILIVGSVMTFVILSFVGPGLSYFFRGFLKSRPAEFSDYVRYSAIQAVFMILFGLVRLFLPLPLMQLLQLAWSVWACFGFFIVFKPDLKRFLTLLAVFFVAALLFAGVLGGFLRARW